ncbi:GNAT family N-acetyltransferase [Streptomyces graminilatus]|uniref:GNAT family N-acetyltransferase n=1 Tax=Streptomyces graminilatus TaxID=1464070 RepID=UPI00099E6F63|nr:GNAT family N-acetyltransferase [Streptomyces graminilatus]
MTSPSPSPQITLRRAAADDAGVAADVLLRSRAAALPTVAWPRSDDEVRDYFRDVLVPHHETWVAEASSTNGDGDGIVGVMVLAGDEVSQLYLLPDWRGRGIGDLFVALAKERGPDGLTLWTFQVNKPAHHFYERHGFVAVEYTDGSGNEEHEPDVRYVWQP